MKSIERRLLAIETALKPYRGVLHFVGYEDTGRYYQTPVRPDYRRGLHGSDEAGDYFTRQDIAELERQGWECNIITIRWVENWRADADIPIATVALGMIDKLLP